MLSARERQRRRWRRNPLKLPDTQYEPIAWAMIDGWADDDHDAAFATFLRAARRSCKAAAVARRASRCSARCSRSARRRSTAKPEKPGEARAFFEQNFRPVRISPLGTPDGFVTGYYEPIVDGMRSKGDGYEYPLYRKPSNLLPGGRMAVAGAPAASDGKKKRSTAQAQARVLSTTAPRSTTARWPAAISKSAG